MHGDFTRWTHRPENHYRSVLLQQGRVLLDADWNEQTEITARHDEVRTRDVVGPSGTPNDGATGGFAVVAVGPDGTVPDGTEPPAPVPWENLVVTPGRYYVDGVLAESEPQEDGAPGWPLHDQPYLRSIGTRAGLPEPEVPAAGTARYALYLDVWTHHVTPDEDAGLLEPALGGPDTTTRARTVWQVRTRAVEDQVCSDLSALVAPPPPRRLAASLRPPESDEDPCRITSVGGYQLLENQLYRVQVHEPTEGGAGGTFLWSRENGSVTAALLAMEPAVAPPTGTVLTLDRAGRDEELSIGPEDVVEVTSTDLQLRGRPGFLATVQASAAEGLELTVTWLGTEPALDSLGRHPVVRRWESPPLPLDAAAQELEGGILVEFPAGGQGRTGEYWLVPARTVRLTYGTATRAGTIDWPTTPGGAALPRPPAGPVHHVAPLAVVAGTPEGWTVESDCRELFPPLSELTALDLVGGDGQEALPGDPLPEPVRVAVRRGGLPVPGAPVRFTVVEGGLSADEDDDVDPDDPAFTAADLVVRTGDDGVAAIHWRLGAADGGPTTQTLTARRVDDHGTDLGVSVVVTGRLSVATKVGWDPPDGCAGFAETRTVQNALVTLVEARELRLLGGDGQHAVVAGQVLPRPVRVVVDGPCGPAAGVDVGVNAGEGLFSPVKEGETLPPETLVGRGDQTDKVAAGPDGVVAVWWQPAFDVVGSSTLNLVHAGAAPVGVSAQLLPAGGRRPGVHITKLRFNDGAVFDNDTQVGAGQLASGITVDLDAAVQQRSVKGKPVVRVELDLPWPFANEGGFWADTVIGYRTVQLAAEWNADGPLIVWAPTGRTRGWLQDTLWGVLAELSWDRPILGRLEIDGWAVVHEEDPRLHLNGHALAVMSDGRTALALPTDDEVTGGTFVQWFHLVRERDGEVPEVRVPGLVGRTLDEAKMLLARAGLVVGQVTTRVNFSVPPGTVLSQDPAEGAQLARGSAVAVTISRVIVVPVDPINPEPINPVPINPVVPVPPIGPVGPDGPIGPVGPGRADAPEATVTVPDVQRMTRARAERLLGEAGLQVRVEEEPSSEVRRSSVISTEPAGGQDAAAGSAVTLRVSSGRKP